MIKFLTQSFVVVISVVVALIFFELALRFQNKYISPNYDIEMWRYSKELKVRVANEEISHVHVKNSQAKLQNVMISTNEIGARGS